MTRVARMLHLPIPDSLSVATPPSAAAALAGTPLGGDTPSSFVSVTPTQPIPSQLHPPAAGDAAAFSPSPRGFTASVLRQVFEPAGGHHQPQSGGSSGSGSATGRKASQEIELSSVSTPEQDHPSALATLRLGEGVSPLSTPVRLLLPAPLEGVDSSSMPAGIGERGNGQSILRERLSATPEPTSQGGMETEEEALTASAGLLYLHASNDALNVSPSPPPVEMGAGGVALGGAKEEEGDEGQEEVCPLGVGLDGVEGGGVEVVAASVRTLVRTVGSVSSSTEERPGTTSRQFQGGDRRPLFSPTPSVESSAADDVRTEEGQQAAVEAVVPPDLASEWGGITVRADGERTAATAIAGEDQIETENAKGNVQGDSTQAKGEGVVKDTSELVEDRTVTPVQHSFLEPSSVVITTEHARDSTSTRPRDVNGLVVEVEEPSELGLRSDVSRNLPTDSVISRGKVEDGFPCGKETDLEDEMERAGTIISDNLGGPETAKRTHSKAECSGNGSFHEGPAGSEEPAALQINQENLLNYVQQDT